MGVEKKKIANKNRKQGKRAESEIAKRTNGVRVGDRGGEDIAHPIFSIEVKSYTKYGFTKFFQQAIANSRGKGKTPCLVCHKKGTPYDESFVIIKMKDAKRFGMFDVKHAMPKMVEEK